MQANRQEQREPSGNGGEWQGESIVSDSPDATSATSVGQVAGPGSKSHPQQVIQFIQCFTVDDARGKGRRIPHRRSNGIAGLVAA